MDASSKDNNISVITAKLFGLILKMPLEERRRLLAQVERKESDAENHTRRAYERKDYSINIDYTVQGRFHKGLSLNLSANGIFVESPKSNLAGFSKSDPVILSFDHPGINKPVKIKGEIARLDDTGIGVRFDQTLLDWQTL